MKGRALSVVGCGPQTATMRFHDGTADRQAHAAALRFRGEEGIENLVRLFGRQSYSGVADRDQHLTALASSRLDREHSAGLLHRLDAIEHKVHQYLLQLHPVRRDFGKIGGNLEMQSCDRLTSLDGQFQNVR